MTYDNEFSGIWHCRYWYHNTKTDREDISEYYVQIDRKGHGYVLHSLANMGEAEGSYLQARFTLDGNVASGTWLEDTSPVGDWGGMIYKGVVQFMKDKQDDSRWEGMWVAATYNNANPKISSGRWEITLDKQKTATQK